MKEITGKIVQVHKADEEEILCSILLNESLSPYFDDSINEFHCNIKSINNSADKKVISKLILNYEGKVFSGLFLGKTGHNKIEISIHD